MRCPHLGTSAGECDVSAPQNMFAIFLRKVFSIVFHSSAAVVSVRTLSPNRARGTTLGVPRGCETPEKVRRGFPHFASVDACIPPKHFLGWIWVFSYEQRDLVYIYFPC